MIGIKVIPQRTWPRELFAINLDGDVFVGGGVLAGEPRGDHVERSLRLREAHAWFQPADGENISTAAIGERISSNGQIHTADRQVGVHVQCEVGAMEVLGRDADDGGRSPIDENLFSNNARISLETFLPV